MRGEEEDWKYFFSLVLKFKVYQILDGCGENCRSGGFFKRCQVIKHKTIKHNTQVFLIGQSEEPLKGNI